ncbi:tetratricopeptide repeat protein [Flavivirga aquimarina]|uniref:Tetratricopeptide repeat protein n=1 Tax=Flavivirga aquimarina TaxID=2027862 RepID=A0ABT8W884_9FLAO|nr:tetratricopeptide repeat protein [Flavivirga aquimarina]MDO5969315.1 tetratricopeptide repeat protein [Flavivirga aquimarina]
MLILFFHLVFTLISFGQTKKVTTDLLLENDSLYRIDINSNKDSLKNISLQKYIKLYYKKRDWEAFNKVRIEHLKFTYKIKDTLSRAKTLEYVAAYFRKNHIIDSTYYYYTKSFQEYDQLKDSLNAGLMLLNLAIIQKNSRDYSGSEYKCRKALKYLNNRANPRRIASVYSNLGVIYNNLGYFDKSLKHHLKALEIRRQKNQNSIYIIHSLNNIGDIHITEGKYEKAIQYFNQALYFDSLINKYPKVKATLLDNHAYARFKKGEDDNILSSFNDAIDIRKQINDKYGMVNNYVHISEYYIKNNNKQNAIAYALKGMKTARQIQHNQGYLKCLELLGNLYDNEKSKTIFNEYTSIRDSLEIADKKRRDSFSSIELMVDEKNILISKQNRNAKTRRRIINILISLSGILLVIVLYFRITKRRQKTLLNKAYEDLKKTKQVLSNKVLDTTREVKEHLDEFHHTLKEKYNLTDVLLEFWILRANRKTKEEMAELLYISINSVIDRRKRLIKVLKEARNETEITRSFLVNIYNEELADFIKTK